MKLNRAIAAIAGFESGIITRRRICQWPPPSTLMASVSSLGMVMKNWRSRKIENASPKKLGMMRGLSVPMNWIPVQSWYCFENRM